MGKGIKGYPHETDGTTTARKATCGPFYKIFGEDWKWRNENERKEEKGKGNERIEKICK